MNRTEHRFRLGVIAAALVAWGLASSEAPAARPHVVLMMADDLGWGDTGYNGNSVIRTPNLDAMSREGLRFDRFYAASSVCSPTRGACLTGRHPYRYGVRTANQGHLRAEEVCLAEVLKKEGYATGHFGKWHLGTLSPDYSGKGPGRKPRENYSTPGMNGFDEWFSTEFAVATWDPYDPENSHLSRNAPYDTRALYWHNGENVEGPLTGCDSKLIADRAIAFIEKAVEADRTFFAVVWFHAPHAPVVGGPEYRAMYSEHDEDAQHYYGVVTALDEQVGRLRRTLKDLEVDENTMLWFSSDNGPEGNPGPRARHQGTAGPLRGRKRSLYEGGVRVPGLLVWPAMIREPRRVDVPCVTSDYFPTVLDVLGLEVPTGRPYDGVSLLPLIRGGMTERPRPIGFQFGSQATLLSGRYKLVRNSGRARPRSDNGTSPIAPFELYDIPSDPSETTNVAEKHPEVVASMRKTLETWIESCRESDAGKDYERSVPTKPPRPDVLLIMPDQMRGDCLSAVGHPAVRTPQIDALAAGGALFRRAYTTVSSCIPARHALLTGLFPDTSGMVGYRARPISVPTLPAQMHKAGYTTVLVGREMHQIPTDEPYGYDVRIHGSTYIAGDEYDTYLQKVAPETGGIRKLVADQGLSNNGWQAKPWPLSEEHHPTAWAVREARRIVAETPAEQHLFLTASFYSPHPPLFPPKEYFDRHSEGTLPAPARGDWVDWDALSLQGDRAGHRVLLQGEALRAAQAGYFGLIEHIDAQIGPLIADFRKRSEKAGRPWVVIMTSDHGEMLGDHGYYRKCEPFEGSANIPFIVAGSPELGFRRGLRSSQPVCLEDVMPTLLDLAGAKVPERVDGVSLVPVLRGEESEIRKLLLFEHAPYYSPEQAYLALTDGHAKYIWRPANGTEHLFDLDGDPREEHDRTRVDSAGEQVARWRARLVERLTGRPEGFVQDGRLVVGRPYPPLQATR